MSHSNTEPTENSITLMNGAVLECFPKKSQPCDIEPDKMQLDATGKYLSIGSEKPSQRKAKAQIDPTEELEQQQKKLFTDNAFYLLAAYTWNGGTNVQELCALTMRAIEVLYFTCQVVR